MDHPERSDHVFALKQGDPFSLQQNAQTAITTVLIETKGGSKITITLSQGSQLTIVPAGDVESMRAWIDNATAVAPQ